MIFISGMPKSGNTYLGKLIGGLQGITTLDECHLFSSDRKDFPPLIDRLFGVGTWAIERASVLCPLTIDYIKAAKGTTGPFIRSLLEETINILYPYPTQDELCDKSPSSNSQDLEKIKRIYGSDARILAPKRYFIDWVGSNLFFFEKLVDKFYNYLGNYKLLNPEDYFYLKQWRKGNYPTPCSKETFNFLEKRYKTFYSSIPAINTKTEIIDYQELINNPISVLTSIFQDRYTTKEYIQAVEKAENKNLYPKEFINSPQIGSYNKYFPDEWIKETNSYFNE